MTATTVTRKTATATPATRARTATDGANALRLDLLERPEPAPRLTRPDSHPQPSRPSPALRPDAATEPETVPGAAPALMPRLRLVLLVLGLVGAGVLGVLMINTRINENAFRIDDLRQRQDTLDLQEQQLSGELAEFDSPGNLAAEARRLGLVPAGTPAYIRLPDGRVIGVPQPATSSAGSTGAGSSSGEPGR